jgi:beta-1,4-mannosyltransferase
VKASTFSTAFTAGRGFAMSRVVVLHSVTRPGTTTNPFVDLHLSNLPPQVESIWFSWRRALTGRYEVIHFQWPENLVRAPTWLKTRLKGVAFRLLLSRLRLSRIPIVITIHNLEPHENLTASQRSALDKLYRRASVLIALNASRRLTQLSAAPVVVIPHGDYSQRFQPRAPGSAIRGRIVYFGAVRDYKNVPRLIETFRSAELSDADLTLTIAGRPYSQQLRSSIENTAAKDPSVRLLLKELEEEDLVEEISKAELVVLPYSKMYNSGAIFLALTIGVPVLVPRVPSTEPLVEEFGPGWVLTYDGELSADVLARTLAQLRASPLDERGPDLSSRDWEALGERYGEVYSRLRDRRNVP